MRNIIFIFLLVVNINIFSMDKNLGGNDFKVILSSENMKDEKKELLDINSASKEQMLSRKIASSLVDRIIEYRDITGGFEKIEELKRIKGVGTATYKKISEKFKISSSAVPKPLYINYADEETLKYFGLNKKEIKKITNFLEKNDKITDNIQLKKIISKKIYEKIKDRVDFGRKEK